MTVGRVVDRWVVTRVEVRDNTRAQYEWAASQHLAPLGARRSCQRRELRQTDHALFQTRNLLGPLDQLRLALYDLKDTARPGNRTPARLVDCTPGSHGHFVAMTIVATTFSDRRWQGAMLGDMWLVAYEVGFAFELRGLAAMTIATIAAASPTHPTISANTASVLPSSESSWLTVDGAVVGWTLDPAGTVVSTGTFDSTSRVVSVEPARSPA
jgi:hypothetical protein